MKILNKVRLRILESLSEDVGREDVTTQFLVPKKLMGDALIEAKEKGILCGGKIVREVFRLVDSKLKVVQKISDGSVFSKGQKVFRISGKITSILKGERVALNFVSHLSGIATVTNQYVQKVRGTQASIYDTRKTTPLWRELEKYAVLIGGGKNHRFGLWDEVLVKDNHWIVLSSLRAKQSNLGNCFVGLSGFLTMTKKKKIPTEIEVDNLKQLLNLLDQNVLPDRILLDNFSVSELKKAVKIVRKRKKRISLEASGGITLKNVRPIAKTGIDRISIGALTHSAPSVDFSLTVSKVTNA